MIQLDQWQKEIIEDKAKYILLCKGRQIGGTSVFSEKAAERMVEKKTTILVGSITEEQAKLVIVMVLSYLEQKYPKLIAKGKNKPTQDRIRLKNGSEFRSRPVGTMGDSFRGFTGNVAWMNEASKWPELAFIAIMPSLLTTGGDIWMDSTPFGKEGTFYKCFLNKDNRWKVYYKTSEEVIYNRPISETWTAERREASIKYLEDQKKEMSEAQYAQEYLGKFIDDLRRLFTEELINKVCVLKKAEYGGGRYYLGVDIAAKGEDKTAYATLLRIDRETIRQVACEHTIKTFPYQTTQRIIELNKIYNYHSIGIDDGGVGVAVLGDLLKENSTKRKVVALNNSRRALDRDEKQRKRLMKEDIYFNLLNLMEKGHIKLLDNEDIRLSLSSMQYQYVIKEGEQTRIRIFGKDNHYSEAIARAAYLASEDKRLNIWVKS